MHSSRMRTGRLLSVFGGVPGPEGVYLVPTGVPGLGGVPGPGGVYPVWGVGVPVLGVYLVLGGVPGPGGCTWSWGVYLVPGGAPGPGRGCLPGTPHGPDQVHPPGTRSGTPPRPDQVHTPQGPDQVHPPELSTHPPPRVDRQTPVDSLPWPNFVAAGNNRVIATVGI